MNIHDTVKACDKIAYQEILIVYSDNLKCYEQHDFLQDERTFVLVCANSTGYVAVAAKMKEWGYLTLKRWMVSYPGGFSFSIPNTAKYRLKCVPAHLLLAHYVDMQDLWQAINRYTRSHAIRPITHDITH